MTPYIYTILAYVLLMLTAKVAFRYNEFKKTGKSLFPQREFNWSSLKEGVLSYFF